MCTMLCSTHTMQVYHPDLHPFPTRRSSDLTIVAVAVPPFTNGVRSILHLESCASELNVSAQPARSKHALRSEEHTSEPSHPSISYAGFCLKKKKSAT